MSSFFNVKNLAKFFIIIFVLSLANLSLTASGFYIVNLEKALLGLDLGKNPMEEHLPQSLLDAGIKVEDINDDFQIKDINNLLNLRRDLPKLTDLPEDIYDSDKNFEESLSKRKRKFIRTYFANVRYMEG